uniref:Uncharacterized protein n=1 Tax=Psilocybe cubensis TaxID=181762 RepID=A0A8H7YBW9_PSICU
MPKFKEEKRGTGKKLLHDEGIFQRLEGPETPVTAPEIAVPAATTPPTTPESAVPAVPTAPTAPID